MIAALLLSQEERNRVTKTIATSQPGETKVGTTGMGDAVLARL